MTDPTLAAAREQWKQEGGNKAPDDPSWTAMMMRRHRELSAQFDANLGRPGAIEMIQREIGRIERHMVDYVAARNSNK